MGQKCTVCPESCVISDGHLGLCLVRRNRGGTIVPETKLTVMEFGPVEKKPLYHFYPGMRVLSVGGLGCNMGCLFCQNFMISHCISGYESYMDWDEKCDDFIIGRADQLGARGIAFCYNEPSVSVECVVRTAVRSRKAGLKTILKTNGYVNPNVFISLCEVFDAVNVDIKGTSSFYRDVCGVDLPDDPHEWVIMKNIGMANSLCHLEISFMVIPEGPRHMSPLFECASDVLFYRDVPIHLVRFIPDYCMRHLCPSSKQEMNEALEIAKEYFDFVYIPYMGNAVSFCPYCGSKVVTRSGIEVVQNRLLNGRCPDCGEDLNFKGDSHD